MIAHRADDVELALVFARDTNLGGCFVLREIREERAERLGLA